MLATPAGFVPLYAPQPAARTRLFAFRGDQLLVRASDLAVPEDDPRVLAALGVRPGATYPVGLHGDCYCCAAAVDAHAGAIDGYVFSGLRPLFGVVDETVLSIAGRAFQITEWMRTHRYCGVCATPTQAVSDEHCLRCPACGHLAYPRISPAMMVLVRRGDTILLARHAARPTNRFTALAGFLEAGESVEDAIHREVFEEVGLEVRDLRYFASQSWPFPHSLMIAFTAEYAGGDLVLEEDEIAEARWFGPDDEIPEIPSGVSIASALINAHLPRRHARR
ncbi:MAG TPA: NAD(+) diphosphatase [Burkholderiaceae bacterium]|nr:NAD(+) diphosphatase [Burkholderiaceae bacterium]